MVAMGSPARGLREFEKLHAIHALTSYSYPSYVGLKHGRRLCLQDSYRFGCPALIHVDARIFYYSLLYFAAAALFSVFVDQQAVVSHDSKEKVRNGDCAHFFVLGLHFDVEFAVRFKFPRAILRVEIVQANAGHGGCS